jgi:hypothetical protein
VITIHRFNKTVTVSPRRAFATAMLAGVASF